MYLTIKQQVKQLSKKDYRNIKKLSHIAKNLTNEAIYNIRQYYFQEKKYLSFKENYRLLKNSQNYKKLNSNMAQQIIMKVDSMFASFFALLQLKKEDKYSQKVKLPQYLPKKGFATLIIGFIRLKGNRFTIPYSNNFKKNHKTITIVTPPILQDKKIKEIRILPKSDARYFEIQYTYEIAEEQRELNKDNALGIDFGINNLAACVTNMGQTFIIDGRRLKSINQWYNKENARLQGIKDKQKKESVTNRQKALIRKRNNQVNDYMAKAARIIINFCLLNDIGNLICGYNTEFQKSSNMGKRNNQNFVNIPFGNLRSRLKYLCDFYGIKYHEQEESYTSKSSFWDYDEIPVYNTETQVEYKFSGGRIHRGMYRTSTGYELNADVNGALNIIRKSNVVSLTRLYSRGEVNTPARIRLPACGRWKLKNKLLERGFLSSRSSRL